MLHLVSLSSWAYLFFSAIFSPFHGTLGYSFKEPTLSVMNRETDLGISRKKLTINAHPTRSVEREPSFDLQKTLISRIRRDTGGKSALPERKIYHFNDSHFVAEVHWSGSNSSVILMLMRDPRPVATRPSRFYISRDYGNSFTDISNKFKTANGTVAVINDYYPSPLDNKFYIFTAKFEKEIYISQDECNTFAKHSLSFTPTKLIYHPIYKRYVLGYDEDHPRNRLYVSTNYGRSWVLKSEYVRKFYWGVKPYDYGSTMYIERRLPGRNSSEVWKTYSWWWYRRTLITGVIDFELNAQYMFATKFNTTKKEIELLVSTRRRGFRQAEFPLRLKKQSYIVADASEDQVFVAINHGNSITNLYISNAMGTRFSLSLSGIVYYHKLEESGIRPYVNHSFVDLYRIQSIYGVYIANQFVSSGRRRWSRTLVSFDKGGKWDPIRAPTKDRNGKPINCRISANCSLHLSQEYAFHNAFTRFQPIFSRKSAPGLILATGSLGNKLTFSSPNVYLSPDAGITWREALRGHWFYRFADHGGIIVAVPRYGGIDTLQYSWNEGMDWNSFKFSDKKLRVYGLLTEPGEKSAIFTVFGSIFGQAHSWLIVQVNMKPVLGTSCKGSDYKNWTVSDERTDAERCLLGRKQTFEKRDPKSKCFNGYNYDRPVVSFNCPCTREDFECDFGFKPQWRTWFERACVDDPNDRIDPYKTPHFCTPGTFYNRTQGYRRISGDTCSGGEEKRYTPVPTACPVQELRNFLLYAARSRIRRISLQDSSQDVSFVIQGMSNGVALDFDYKNNFLYWGDITKDVIQRLHLNGSGFIEKIVSFNESRSHVEAVALDWLANNIYWVDPGMKTIGVVKASGGFERKVLIKERLGRPRALVLDPKNGYMYWTDWGSPAKIEKAQMDGQGRKTIINSGLYWPNGITMDHDKQRLYWTDAGRDRIESSNVNGGDRKTVLSQNVPHPYAITFYNNALYWDDWSSRSIETVSINGNGRKRLRQRLSGIMDLKAFFPAKQQGTNGCSRSSCQFLCLSTPGKVTCACPDNLLTQRGSDGSVTCTCPPHETLINGKCESGNNTCRTDEFRCANGNCMPRTWRCDHDNDCGDNSDEIGCSYATCSPSQFECTSHRCIPSTWKCDGDHDCSDGSDEKECSRTCSPSHFTCNNSRCINKAWVCDGDNDCYDYSDEVGCPSKKTTTVPPPSTCSSNEFRCRDGSCIPSIYYCNAEQDCRDGSDETPTCTIHCSDGKMKCATSRQCIWKYKKCNGVNDCHDQSDEKNCPHSTHRPMVSTKCEFRCGSGECIRLSDKCNGSPECYDKSDEKNCPTPTYFVCPGGSWRCRTDFTCLTRERLCDGILDCKDGSDEQECGTARPHKCNSFPFGFNCSNGEYCFSANSRCNSRTDCTDSSDEDVKVCGAGRGQRGKLDNLRAEAVTSKSFRLAWNRMSIGKDVEGFYIEYKTLSGDTYVLQPPVYVGAFSYTLKGLRACTKYTIAAALRYKGVDKKDWIFRTTSVTTKIDMSPAKVSDISFHQTKDDEGELQWRETDVFCFGQKKTVFCQQLDSSLENNTVSGFPRGPRLTLSNLVSSGLYKCTIVAEYNNLENGQRIKLQNSYTFRLSTHVAKPGKSQTLVWAIPVALVVLILVIALVIIVFKYRNLQRSFLAFANRGYTRASEEEEDMAVAFHQGEDAPMINRFSDDEPLVVA